MVDISSKSPNTLPGAQPSFCENEQIRPSCAFFRYKTSQLIAQFRVLTLHPTPAEQFKLRLERCYRKSGLTVDMEVFHEQTQKYNNLLEKTKTDYYGIKIQISDHDQFFHLINNMLKLKPTALPSHQSSQQLAEDFNDVFINKISDIRAGLNNTEAAFVETRELSCHILDFDFLTRIS